MSQSGRYFVTILHKGYKRFWSNFKQKLHKLQTLPTDIFYRGSNGHKMR